MQSWQNWKGFSMLTVTEYRRKYNEYCGQKKQLNKELLRCGLEIKRLRKERRDAEQAQTIIQVVAQETQNQLAYHIAEPVSLALASIQEDPYSLNVNFEIRRGRTECDLMFERNGQLSEPLDSTGGGCVDIASFGLRMARWSLNNDTRPVFLLDQPTHELSGRDLQKKAGEMMKEVCSKLGAQLIVVSHSPAMAEAGDRVYRFQKNNGITRVEREI